jgi:hypothetical protein
LTLVQVQVSSFCTLPSFWLLRSFDSRAFVSGQKQTGYTVAGTAWYRKNFTLDATDSHNRVFVRFDGIYMNSGASGTAWRSHKNMQVQL